MNKAILIGNLGRDPEVRYTSNGTAVSNMSIATTERYKDKSGERQEKVEWHQLVAWNRTAEIAGEYLRKESKIAVEGKLQTREWEDKDGNKRTITEVVVSHLEMLGEKQGQSSTRAAAKPKQPRQPRESLKDYYSEGQQDGIPF